MTNTIKNDTTDALLRQLKEPFDPKLLKWRVGATNEKKENGRVTQSATKGIALAYIDAREIMKRLDDVMGVAGWQDRYIEVKDGFICELDLWIDGRWITKSGTAGHTKVEPIKGGGSDALKRAASVWGVGRYLYYIPNIWVELNEYKKFRQAPALPKWALPGSGLERWEDVAELEADMQGVDIEGEPEKSTKITAEDRQNRLAAVKAKAEAYANS